MMISRIIAISSLIFIYGCQQKETASDVSPDGSFVAKFFDERDGGPTVAAYQRIEIASTSSNEQVRVFSGENMDGRATNKVPFGDINVSWRDQRTLLIEYCGGDIDEYVQSAKIDGKTIGVILSQAPREEWPDTVPLNQRASLPPCR